MRGTSKLGRNIISISARLSASKQPRLQKPLTLFLSFTFKCVLVGWLAMQGLICKTIEMPPLCAMPDTKNAFPPSGLLLALPGQRVSSVGTIV